MAPRVTSKCYHVIPISTETWELIVGTIHSHYTRDYVLQDKGQNLDHILMR